MKTISYVAGLASARGTAPRLLWPAGIALGVASAWIAQPELVVLDTLTGFVLVGLGLTAWSLRPRSGTGVLTRGEHLFVMAFVSSRQPL